MFDGGFISFSSGGIINLKQNNLKGDCVSETKKDLLSSQVGNVLSILYEDPKHGSSWNNYQILGIDDIFLSVRDIKTGKVGGIQIEKIIRFEVV